MKTEKEALDWIYQNKGEKLAAQRERNRILALIEDLMKEYDGYTCAPSVPLKRLKAKIQDAPEDQP